MIVLMIRPRLEPGGATEHIDLLCHGLRQVGIEVLLATHGGASAHTLGQAGVEILKSRLSPSSPWNLLIASAQLARIVRRRGISIIHSHHRFGTLVGRLVAGLTGVPLLVTVHEFRHSHRRLGRALAGDVTIVPSHALARHLQSHYRFDPDTIVVIPNAIPVEAGEPAGQRARRGQSSRALAVGYLGRLSVEKGVRYFVESIPLAARQCPGTRYLVFGQGPQESELRELAKRLNLGESILSFRGWCAPQEAMEEVDLLVIPSLVEAFGYAALEAMRASLPVVATSVGGLPEIVADHESGLLVPPGDPAAIASAVCALLNDPDMCLRFGRRGRAILEERFGLEGMIHATIRVYARVLGQGTSD
jgi:glycosyltransferase involved in cell wall biosynthesis